MESLVRPGITTQDLNDACEALIRERGAFPIFLGYHGFPAAVCVSVNEEIVHGIPDGRKLKEGREQQQAQDGPRDVRPCGDRARAVAHGLRAHADGEREQDDVRRDEEREERGVEPIPPPQGFHEVDSRVPAARGLPFSLTGSVAAPLVGPCASRRPS
jgi:hypothetical protein